jgi:hypothetical protein
MKNLILNLVLFILLIVFGSVLFYYVEDFWYRTLIGLVIIISTMMSLSLSVMIRNEIVSRKNRPTRF